MLTPEQDGYLARYAALVKPTGLSNDALGSTIIAVNLELAALRKQVAALTTERDNARLNTHAWKRRVTEAANVVGNLETQVRDALTRYADPSNWLEDDAVDGPVWTEEPDFAEGPGDGYSLAQDALNLIDAAFGDKEADEAMQFLRDLAPSSKKLAEVAAQADAWTWVKAQAEAGAYMSVDIEGRLYSIDLEPDDGGRMLSTDYFPTIAEAVTDVQRLRALHATGYDE